MIETLNEGLKASGAVASIIEKLAKGILGMTDRKRKKTELKRLIDLLNQVRIGRTLNAGLFWYLQTAIKAHQDKTDFKEIEIVVQQIDEGFLSLLQIIDTMTEEQDRVVIYQNSAWNELHRVVDRRKLLLQELKEIRLNEKNLKAIAEFSKRYEHLSRRLDDIAFDLSKHGQQLDSA